MSTNVTKPLRGIIETSLYADDLQAAERFYRDVLGLRIIGREEGRHVFFRCGRGVLLIFRAEVTRSEEGRTPTHGADGPGHVAFDVPQEDLDVWTAHLRANRVEIDRVVEWGPQLRSLYFRDPAGNSLELASPQLWGTR